jgi:hypothetical protein
MSSRLTQRALRLTRVGLLVFMAVGLSHLGASNGGRSGENRAHVGERDRAGRSAHGILRDGWRTAPEAVEVPAGGFAFPGGFRNEPALAADPALAGNQRIDIPFQLIDRRFRRNVRALVDSPTITRRLPPKVFHTDRKTYEYLLDDLPLSSKLSTLLGFGRYAVTEREEGCLHGDDGHGVSGDFWLAYSDPAKRIYFGVGSFHSWFFPKVSGEVVLAVQFQEVAGGPPRGQRQSPAMVSRVDVYLRTNRLVGYIIDFLGQTADKKLTKLISSAQLTSEKLSSEPHEVWGAMTSSGLFAPGELESFEEAILEPAEAPRIDGDPQRP